jgi:hypothetical protein
VLARSSFDYAVVRVVPRVERGEFLNAGVILFCRTRRFLDARIELDQSRLTLLYPGVDAEEVGRHLALIPAICAGGRQAGAIGQLSLAERFHWLVSPKSAMIQTSPVHSGVCGDPQATLEHLLDMIVRVRTETSANDGVPEPRGSQSVRP